MGVAAVGVRGKVGVTTYDLPGVYINSRINNASPLNLLLPFYISDVGTLPCICRCNTFVQLWEPTNRTSSSWGGGYTVSVLVASCGPRDALTYSRRAFPASMTKVSNEYQHLSPPGGGSTPMVPGTPRHGNIAFNLQGRAYLVAP